MNTKRIWALAHKEWREIVRDRIFLALAFVMPAMLMFVFGHGISMDVRDVPLAVVDYDRTETSRTYLRHFANSEYFAFTGHAESERGAARLLSNTRARVIVIVPAGFESSLRSGQPSSVQTLIDGSYGNGRGARQLDGYIEAINTAASTEQRAMFLARRLGIEPDHALGMLRPLELDVRYLYNPELKSDWSIAPSLIMFVMIFVAPMLMSLSVVREKETGSISNVYASTLRRGEFLLGKLLPNAAIAAANTAVLWLIATLHFGAPFKGSLSCFALGSLLYVLCTTALGLVVSLLVSTQQAALIIVGVLASILGFQYSGLFTPIASLSGFPWLIAHAFPPMYYLEVVQGTFLKGMGFSRLWPALLVLGGFSAGYFTLAHALFHKRTRA